MTDDDLREAQIAYLEARTLAENDRREAVAARARKFRQAQADGYSLRRIGALVLLSAPAVKKAINHE